MLLISTGHSACSYHRSGGGEFMIRDDVLRDFPDLFGTKKVNGREVNVEKAIETLTRELRPEIAAALTARQALLASPSPVTDKYARLRRRVAAAFPARWHAAQSAHRNLCGYAECQGNSRGPLDRPCL